jgi:predicted ATPase/class 3 adenylate cyclase
VALPSGTVTFLFTDIEGSTRLWETAPEAMQVALERHDVIVRGAIEGHGGYVFSTAGDGFAAVFARAGNAVEAAGEAQVGLGGEAWPEGVSVRVRMGLHTGETVERGGDYFGSVVNRAARLMAVGHGGQVLCSQATAEVVRTNVALVDLGAHRLRDLDRPMHVFQVGAGSFPALRSLDVLPGNLPSLASSFVGRQAELAAVAQELGASRLVTLTGVGGVGKTRLALQVAADLVPGFTDGAWFCELSAASNVDDMARVVAVALGVVQRAQMTVAESIVDFLRPRHLLVILDNCEHVLDAAAELAESLLAGAPAVRILATSREGLGISGERIWPLRSLAVASDLAEARDSDAVVLFAERAQAVTPAFVLDEARTPGVVEVCRRLDGIPLAIELAAARAAVMSPAEIAGHLDERFRLLTGARRGRVERHQTLRAAVEWSYSLLTDTEQTVFDRLGVFPASFDEAAAVAVCTSDELERWDILDALAGLVVKSMVVADQSSEPTRYQLLETLRHFARDRAGGDLDRLRRRHAAHYAEFAEEAGAGLATPDELLWRRRVAIELDNLRTAAGWAFDSFDLADLVLGVRIVDALLIEPTTLQAAGMQVMAASALPRIGDLSAAQRAVVLSAAAHSAWQAGRYDEAKTLGTRAITESKEISFALTGSVFMVCLANLAAGDAAAARRVVDDCWRRHAVQGATEWRTAGIHNIASFLADQVGDDETARSHAEQSLAIARRIGGPTLLANALARQCRALVDDSPTEALAAAEECMRLIETGAGDVSYSPTAQIAATLRVTAGDPLGAARAMRAAIAHEARIGNLGLLTSNLRVTTAVLGTSRTGLDTAAVVVGAITGPVLGRYPVMFSPYFRAIYQRALKDVETALGPDAYAAAQQRGAAMSYDEIVAYSLEQLDRLAEPDSEADR